MNMEKTYCLRPTTELREFDGHQFPPGDYHRNLGIRMFTFFFIPFRKDVRIITRTQMCIRVDERGVVLPGAKASRAGGT